jgi:hypothetical protein
LTNSLLRKTLDVVLPVTVLCAVGATSVPAQRGGKAEPLRVEFKRRATSTKIDGTVRGSEEAEYVLAAKKGQRLIIKLTSVPLKSSCFDLKGPDQAEMGLDSTVIRITRSRCPRRAIISSA